MALFTFKFTPVESFFFGGEKHEPNDKGEPVTNYFVESNAYPQQTTLLGAIRYFLLQSSSEDVFKNNRIQSKELASKLIGKKSFSFNPKADEMHTFGAINRISGLYFDHEGEKYFFAPFDYGCSIKEGVLINPQTANSYTQKCHGDFISELLVNNNGKTVALSEIITGTTQVGNKKKTVEEAYYKQNVKKMASGWSFAVDVDIDFEFKNKTAFIHLGGEKSIFKLDISESDAFMRPSLNGYVRGKPYLICISDAFVKAESLKTASWGVTETVSFRNLISNVSKTKKYGGLAATDEDKLRRSTRYNLLKRGSVLYFEDDESMQQLKADLEANKTSRNIGFNQYISTNLTL